VPGHGISWRFLKALTGQARATGYEPVLDVVLNAERRASRGRFDDAVARLYRAIELLAQTRLKKRDPPLDSSDLDLEKLPEPIQPKYQRMRELNELRGWGSKVQIGLVSDYVLLQELGDPLGRVYAPLADRLRQALENRNQSILAHGGTPLTQGDCDVMRGVAHTLLTDGLATLDVPLDAPQFPILTTEGLQQRDERL
jgi:CRISPR-associated protein (TIGR02710 family)